MAYTDPPKHGLTPVSAPDLDFSGLLASLGSTVRDRYYKGAAVHLDGYTFINCCFHNCTLITETGVFTLDACTIAGCNARFGINAIKIVRLFNVWDGASKVTLFNAEVAADGGITIK